MKEIIQLKNLIFIILLTMPIKKLFYTLLKSIGVSFYHQNTLTLVTCPVKLKFRLSKILSDLN